MRTLIAVVAAVVALLATAAVAVAAIHQSGRTSQNRPVALRTDDDSTTIQRFAISWTARCGGTRSIYRGNSARQGLTVTNANTFSGNLSYTHKLKDGRKVKVFGRLTGKLSGDGLDARGTFKADARIPRLPLCRSGAVTWRATAP